MRKIILIIIMLLLMIIPVMGLGYNTGTIVHIKVIETDEQFIYQLDKSFFGRKEISIDKTLIKEDIDIFRINTKLRQKNNYEDKRTEIETWYCNYKDEYKEKCSPVNDNRRCYYTEKNYYYCRVGWIKI